MERPTYVIRRTEDWANASAIALRETGWLAPAGIEATAMARHDGENLYILMEAKEERIRAEEREPLAAICEDSCLEFFFAPDAEDARYLNFEWNLLGNLYLGFGAERNTRLRQITPNKDALFCPKPYKTAGGWGVEFRIPLSFVQLYFPRAAFAGEAAGNFYKCGDKTEQPHYLSWAPMTSETPDFHRRQDFGRLVFE